MIDVGRYAAQLLPRALRGTVLYNIMMTLLRPLVQLNAAVGSMRGEMLAASMYDTSPLMLERAVYDIVGIKVDISPASGRSFVVRIPDRYVSREDEVRGVIDRYRMLGTSYSLEAATMQTSCAWTEHVCERVLQSFSCRFAYHVCEVVQTLDIKVGYPNSDEFVWVFADSEVQSPVTVRIWETATSQPVSITLPAYEKAAWTGLTTFVKAEMKPFSDENYYYKLYENESIG
mgnify:CR=1 FL=1